VKFIFFGEHATREIEHVCQKKINFSCFQQLCKRKCLHQHMAKKQTFSTVMYNCTVNIWRTLPVFEAVTLALAGAWLLTLPAVKWSIACFVFVALPRTSSRQNRTSFHEQHCLRHFQTVRRTTSTYMCWSVPCQSLRQKRYLWLLILLQAL